MTSVKLSLIFFLLLLITNQIIFPQSDTIKYNWPLSPMTTQREIGGTFAEYRSTSVEGHYHNGTDITGAGGTPVYAVLGGTVAVAYNDGSTGYDSYVRITSTINGQTKNITYYHCNPSVSVGQTVAIGQQVATIAIDHVHLIDYRLGGGISGSHLNALRPDGGLTPYNDPWKPNIRFVRFYLDNTDIQLNPNSLGSRVDIVVHVEEVNGTSSAAANNGTYKIGYRILSADGQTVVYNPPDNGLRYQYYNKPGDSYVNVNYYRPESNTSRHVYIVTNGSGASSVASTQTVSNNYWDVTQFPFGQYKVLVFTEDVRGNKDSVIINVTTSDIDLIPPQQPNLKYVKKDSTNYFTIAWNPPPDADLKGYRLYYSTDGSSYTLRDNESVLTNLLSSKTYYFPQQYPLYLKLYAVDSASITNISTQSDVYAIRMKDENKILIVDGFNRTSGSWTNPYHDFVVKHAETLNLSYETCHNSQIINNNINLNNYHAVIWLLGDESTADETFSSVEQTKVANYLENGGKLFVTGSEIAWDLEGASSVTSSDTQFLRNYLKAKFVADNSNIKVAIGEPGTLFEGLLLQYGTTGYGSPYIEDYPDVIDTNGGSVPFLRYNASMFAGIAYTGSFGNSSNTGQVVYIGFPFETIGNLTQRTSLMTKVFQYFGMIPIGVEDGVIELPNNFILYQNYPNPFNPSTNIKFYIPEMGRVKIKLYDILGKEISILLDEDLLEGEYNFHFDAAKLNTQLASGVYFYSVETSKGIFSKKMIYLK